MSPRELIAGAAADGVTLSLSPQGTIKAAGDAAAVERWAPAIRAHKMELIAALADSDKAWMELRRWLSTIGEDDQSIINAVRSQCEKDPGAKAYFLEQARNRKRVPE